MESNSGPGSPDDHFAPPSTPSDTDYRHARPSRLGRLRTSPSAGSTRASFSSNAHAHNYKDPRLIIVVGVCSSGKSTLVKSLKEKGYRVRVCAQEHSYVAHLWQLSNPDLLVYLDASLHTIRGRGRARWQQTMLDEEHRRLSNAREHCQLYVHTDGISPEDVTSRVVTFLNNHQPPGVE